MLTFPPSMHSGFSPDQHLLAGLTEPPSPEDEQKLLLYINLKLRGSKGVGLYIYPLMGMTSSAFPTRRLGLTLSIPHVTI